MKRRHFLMGALASSSPLLLGGCTDGLSRTSWFPRVLNSAESLSAAVQRGLTGQALVKEYTEADISPVFRPNGSTDPQTEAYRALAENDFRDYRLEVDGMVERPMSFSLEELHALPSRTQITRHDCVEGWSVSGKWKGARLSALLDRVQPEPQARYVVFFCADALGGEDSHYYESMGMDDAYHPQTLLAYDLNDAPVPIGNGSPLRVRNERQLGYKMAKYVMRIELRDRLDDIEGGNGGYWEDRGYAWYAGI